MLKDRPSSCLKKAEYYTDIPASTPKERDALKLARISPIDGLQGNRLSEAENPIPGINTVFAYVATGHFGTPFGLHVEDWVLWSWNLLLYGTKTWIIISPSDYELLIQELLNVNPDISKYKCSQLLRHCSLYIPTGVLESLKIPYKVVVQ